MEIQFEHKFDRSPQGSFDEDIISLLNIINQKFKTTSSCSGRITLMDSNKKGEAQWILKSHSKVSTEKIYTLLKEHRELKFFFEPLILHFACKDFEETKNILSYLQNNGFRKTSCISLKSFNIEIRDTGRFETILTDELPLEYIDLLVSEANKRLAKTKENIKTLENLFLNYI